MIAPRERLTIDLHHAGFRVIPGPFARTGCSAFPNLFPYRVEDASSGAHVTDMIVETCADGGIRVFWRSGETIPDQVARVLDIAAAIAAQTRDAA